MIRNKSSLLENRLTLYERLFVAMVSLVPLALFNIKFGLGWSADRLLLMLLLVFFPFYYKYRCSSLGVAGYAVALLLFFLMFGSILTADFGISLKFLPSLVQSYILFGLTAFVIKNNPRAFKIVKPILYSWVAILVVFSCYMIFFYYILGLKYVPFPFGGEYSDEEHRMAMMRSQRLFLPFASAPFLGAVSGFIALWSLTIFIRTKQWLILGVGFIMLLITILTMSRGPVLSLIVSFSFFMVAGFFLRVIKRIKPLLVFILLATAVALIIMFIQEMQVENIGRASLDRLSIDIDEIGQSRHLDIRLNALGSFVNGSFVQILFGQGLGSYGVRGIGAYTFSSYLTILVETGVFEALVFLFVVSYPLFKCWKGMFSAYNSVRFMSLHFFVLALYISLTHLFYELKTLQSLWLQLAFVFGMSQSGISFKMLLGRRLGV
jgi:hypothetical protein